MDGNLSKQSFCRTLRRSSAVKTWSPRPKPFFRFFTHRSIRASGRACNMLCKSLSLKASAPWVPWVPWVPSTWPVAGWQLEGPKIRVTRNRSSLRSSSSPADQKRLNHVEPPWTSTNKREMGRSQEICLEMMEICGNLWKCGNDKLL